MYFKLQGTIREQVLFVDMMIKKNGQLLLRIHVQNKQRVSNPDLLTEIVCKQIVTESTGKTKYQTVKTLSHKS